MKPRELIDFLGVIEKLKCNTRRSWTSSGRQESVAEHSWRLSVMAILMRGEYSELEEDAVNTLLSMLPRDTEEELSALFLEMRAFETPEAKLYTISRR